MGFVSVVLRAGRERARSRAGGGLARRATKMAQERGFERRGCGLALFFRCPTAAHRRKACHQTQRSVRRNRAAEPSCSERIDSRAGPAPPGAISGAAAARAAPRRRKTRCHGAQPRPRGASLGPTPPPVPPWAHRGASMRRHGSPIARRRARSRAAEHPQMAARAASAARAGVAEAEKVSPTPNATQGRKFRSPIAPSAPWGRPGA